MRSASGGTRESKVTSPNLCRLEQIQLEKTDVEPGFQYCVSMSNRKRYDCFRAKKFRKETRHDGAEALCVTLKLSSQTKDYRTTVTAAMNAPPVKIGPLK